MTARDDGVPPWVVDALGPGSTELERLPWGFTNETWAGTTEDGRRLVATRFASPAAAAAMIERGPELARRLGAVGVETPVPVVPRSIASLGVVVTEWIAGTPAMVGMASSEGGEAAGRAAAETWRALARVDTIGLDLDDLWGRPDALAVAARRWLARVRVDLEARALSTVRERIDGATTFLRDRAPGFVHGDLVPANLLLRPDRPAALLDLESVRIADPLLDAAWFRWIVRYHHPEIERPAWTAFRDAAGIDVTSPRVAALVATLPAMRILEILSDRRLAPASRARWIDQLRAAVASGTGDA